MRERPPVRGLSPTGDALFLAFIGIVLGTAGLFLPLALAAAVVVAIVQTAVGGPVVGRWTMG